MKTIRAHEPPAGWYELEHVAPLDEMDNVITRVNLVSIPEKGRPIRCEQPDLYPY